MSDRVRESLMQNRVGRWFVLLFENLDEHHAPTAAGAMAFDAFLSLVPLLAIAGYLLHVLRQDGDLVMGPILAAAPGPVRQLLDTEFFRLSDAGAAIVAPVSIGAFLWVSSAGVSTAMVVFEAIFHSPPRPWYIRRPIAIAAVVVGFLVLLLVLTVGVFLAGVWGSFGAHLLAFIVPPLVIIGSICGFFRIAIRGPRPLKRQLVPGALVTVILWSLVSGALSFYVAKLSRHATLYGGLAAVAIFMFWLWLLALSLLVGGEVNAQLEGVRETMTPNSVRSRGLMAPLPAERLSEVLEVIEGGEATPPKEVVAGGHDGGDPQTPGPAGSDELPPGEPEAAAEATPEASVAADDEAPSAQRRPKSFASTESGPGPATTTARAQTDR